MLIKTLCWGVASLTEYYHQQFKYRNRIFSHKLFVEARFVLPRGLLWVEMTYPIEIQLFYLNFNVLIIKYMGQSSTSEAKSRSVQDHGPVNHFVTRYTKLNVGHTILYCGVQLSNFLLQEQLEDSQVLKYRRIIVKISRKGNTDNKLGEYFSSQVFIRLAQRAASVQLFTLIQGPVLIPL